MLACEWRELEELCERILAMRERLNAAHKTGNTGLIEGLNAEIEGAVRRRDRLVRFISTRLGSAAFPSPHPDPPHAGNGGEPVAMPR